MMLHLPVAAALTAALAASALRAQCDPIVAPFAPSADLTGAVYTAIRDSNGDLIAGGQFGSAFGIPLTGLARWDGIIWSPVATFGGSSWTVHDLFQTRNGDLYVFGVFSSVDGVAVNGAARRDANGWHPVPTETVPIRHALVEDANGNVYVNSNGVSRWDGVAWTSLGAPMVAPALAILSNGDLVAAGRFFNSGPVGYWGLARWDGTTWTVLQPVHPAIDNPMGRAVQISSLRTLRNGDLLVGGSFTQPFGNIAVWNSSGWHDVGGSFFTNLSNPPFLYVSRGVVDTAELPNGDLVACGELWKSLLEHGDLARFDGTSWHVSNSIGFPVRMTAFDETSYVIARSGVTNNTPRVLFYQATCPAATASIGTACPSSGGNNELTADGLPWIGSTFATHATGLPTTCVVAVVNGFTTFDHPLANVLPMAAPSCEHRETMDMLDLLVTSNGTATWSVALPEVPALVGLVAYQQMFPLELDAQAQILAASSTNTLRLQVGTF